MVVGDRLGDVLEQHGLAGARRRDDQRALALALRRDDVDHPRRLVLDRRIGAVEGQLLVGIERREIVEIDAVADRVGIVEIDLRDAGSARNSARLPWGRGSRLRPCRRCAGRSCGPGWARRRCRRGRRDNWPRASAGSRSRRCSTSIVPMPMISSPLSARTLRIENIRSCLRRVDAPSTPELFGHGDQFGGGFLLEVFQMHVGLWLRSECGKIGLCLENAGRGRTPHRDRRCIGKSWNWPIKPSPARYAAGAAQVNARETDSRLRKASRSPERRSSRQRCRNLVHDPQRLVVERALAPSRASCRRRPIQP